VKLGISTYAYSWSIGIPGNIPAEPMDSFTFLECAASLGIRVVQIADNLPLHHLDVKERAKLRLLAESKGIHFEVGTRGLLEDNIAKYLDLAIEFDSPILRVVIDRDKFKPAPDEIIRILKRILPQLKAKDIILAIENHDRFSSSTLAFIIRSLETPYIGICLDTVNSFVALEGPEIVITNLAPYTVNLHLKDFTIERMDHKMGFIVEGTPAGRGRLNISYLFQQLKKFRRDPNAILELWITPEETLEDTIKKEHEWVKKSVTYLRKIIVD